MESSRVKVLLLVVVVVLAGCNTAGVDGGDSEVPEDNQTDTSDGETDGDVKNGSSEMDSDTDSESESETSDGTENDTDSGDSDNSNNSGDSDNSNDEEGDQDESSSDGDNQKIDVEGGELSFNHTKVYDRVQEMLGTDVPPPHLIVVNKPDYAGMSDSGVILLDPELGRDSTESVLSHEYFHYIQENWFPNGELRNNIVKNWRTEDKTFKLDQSLVLRAMKEGAAEILQIDYSRKYISENRNWNYWDSKYVPSPSPNARFFLFAYHSSRYFDSRTNSTQDIWEVYENPPKTTEQIIHGYLPSEEPALELRTRAKADSSNWSFGISDPTGYDRIGEFLIRNTLRTRLDKSFSYRAAEGWGNDHLLKFTNIKFGDANFAWVIRTDTSKDADELEKAFEEFGKSDIKEFGDRYTQETPDRTFSTRLWRDESLEVGVERINENTLVVLAGSEKFLKVTDTRTNSKGEVVVSIPEDSGS